MPKPRLKTERRVVDLLLKEEWRSIPGWEGLFVVSNRGSVKRLAREVGYRYMYKGRVITMIPEKILTPGSRRYVDLQQKRKGKSRRRYSIAELVLTAFVGPRPTCKSVARHLDDDYLNNDLLNLAWGSRRDNRLDSVRNGRQSAGSEWAKKVSAKLKGRSRSSEIIELVRNSRKKYFKLTETDVLEIRSSKLPGSILAAHFQVHRSLISNIRLGKVWKTVNG